MSYRDDKPFPGRPPLTLLQAKALSTNDYVCLRYFRYGSRQVKGRVAVAKINGWPKTWVRSPEKVRVPWKFGMYDFGVVDETNLEDYSWCDGGGGWLGDRYPDLDRLAAEWIKRYTHERAMAKLKKAQRFLP